MATTVADLAVADHAEVAYVLMIQGIKWFFTTHEDLTGSDWANQGAHADGRIGLLGLKPPEWTNEVDYARSGLLRTNGVTFEVVDHDGTLATLFATDGKTVATLNETIDAGTTNLASDLTVVENSLTPWAKEDAMIGLERTGPSGQRNYYDCWFFNMPGPRHSVDTDNGTYDKVEIPVSAGDSPILFEGRRVALYRVYRDIHSNNGDYTDWPNTVNQVNSGYSLCWWGTLRDRGRLKDGKTWELDCFGPDSLLKGSLNTHSMHDWMGVQASTLTLDTNPGTREDGIAVAWESLGSDVDDNKWFDSCVFNYDDSRQITSGQEVTALVSEIAGIIENSRVGTANYNNADPPNVPLNFIGGTVNAWETNNFAHGPDALFDEESVGVRINDTAEPAPQPNEVANARQFVMRLVMHEKVWKYIGWEPSEQDDLDPTDPKWARFDKVAAGEEYFNSGEVVPAPGYWEGSFFCGPTGSVAPGPASTLWDNNGAWRYYWKAYDSGAVVLDADGDEVIKVTHFNNPRIEGQLFQNVDSTTIDGNAVNRLRLFLFKGPVRIGKDTFETYQVAVCQWYTNANSETPRASDGTYPDLHIRQWLDPRAFGLNNPPLKDMGISDWVAQAGQIQCIPLGNFQTPLGGQYPGITPMAIAKIMYSTGTASWSGAQLTAGDNAADPAPNGPWWWCNDTGAYDFGLGIPEEIIQAPVDMIQPFDDVSAEGYQGPLNRFHYAVIGSVQAEDVIETLLAPTGLAMGLYPSGSGPGVAYTFWAPWRSLSGQDVDVVIGEGDLASPDPPGQELRAVGQVDETHMDYRYDPNGEGLMLSYRERARDRGARYRPGVHTREIDARGLLPVEWWGTDVAMEAKLGVGTWKPDFRELWGMTIPAFWNKRHFFVKGLHVARPKGQNLNPGAVVRLTNPWPLAPDGTYGLTNALGWVIRARHHADCTCHVDILIHADSTVQPGPFFAPVLRLTGYNETTRVLTYKDDWLGHGDAGIDDGDALTVPAWVTGYSGSAVLRFYRYDRSGWTQHATTATITSVDTAAKTITLDSPGLGTGNWKRDQDWLCVFEKLGSNADWVDDLFGYIVEDDYETAGGTKGRKYLP